MVRSIEGIFRNGKVELLEPASAANESRVIITFLSTSAPVDLSQKQISPQQAEDLLARLKTFQDDWSRPEMDAYDAL